MLIRSSVFKLVLGGLFTLGITAALVTLSLLPQAPEIDSFNLHVNCSVSVRITDHASNETGYRIYFRPLGAKNFTLIKILAPLPGGIADIALPPQLPNGSYEYKVTVFNSWGERSATQTINITTCPNLPPLPSGDPLPILVNPLITEMTVNPSDCFVIVKYLDMNSLPQLEEDGLRIYRMANGANEVKLADMPPAENDVYLDGNVPAGSLQYRVSAYKGSMEVFSEYSALIEMDASCSGPSVLQLPQNLPPKKLSCDWQAVKNAFLRKGPNVGIYDKLDSVQAGQSFPIVGQSEDGRFWAVQAGPGVGYITKSGTYSRTDGDCSSVPTLPDPPPPVIKAAPTDKPAGGHDNGNPVSTSCSPDPAVICP